MNAVEYLAKQMAAMRRYMGMVVQDLSQEQFNWQPPGSANRIGAICLHLIASEDSYIHSVIQGKPRLWDTEDWGAKMDINPPPGRGNWEGIKGKTVPLELVLAYQRVVLAATDAYLAALTDEELVRRVNFIGGEQPVADILATMVVHTSFHVGEISALKGVQGLKGLPI